MDLTDDQLLRYSRHILLPELGIEGQQRLEDATVLLVGAGGLGSPAAMYLAASGVGHLVLCDGDEVDLTNLQRQILHATASIGAPKVDSARETLARLNPGVKVTALRERLTPGRALELATSATVVVDGTDNFATRHAINRACVQARVPLVSGAGIRFDGQVTVFDLRQPDSPCYHCLFPEGQDLEETRCAVMGVFAPLVGIIGSVQAAEAIKLITDLGTPLTGRLLMLDALAMQWRSVRFKRDPACAVCATPRGEAGI